MESKIEKQLEKELGDVNDDGDVGIEDDDDDSKAEVNEDENDVLNPDFKSSQVVQSSLRKFYI